MAHRTVTFDSISSMISEKRTPSAVVTVLPACGRLKVMMAVLPPWTYSRSAGSLGSSKRGGALGSTPPHLSGEFGGTIVSALKATMLGCFAAMIYSFLIQFCVEIEVHHKKRSSIP
jgi:hypothetical protein